MRTRLYFSFLLLASLTLAPSPTYAQTGSARSSLTGVVSDTSGGAIPGATVVVKNNATGVASSTVTNSTGAFSVPSLDIGTYTVTVSLGGFKTAVVNDVVVIVGSPASIQVALEVGSVSETVEVRASTELVQIQTTAVTSTINANQIQNLPLTSRNALFGFVVMLPGVDTLGSPRDAKLFGLPEQAINITIDGINTQNNFQRNTDGFYSMVFPQLDAVEQVTVTGAAAGAEAAAGGSVGIRFVTRSGGNSYRGTGYYYLRHPNFNTNYYFNDLNDLPKNRLILNQMGGSIGGPIRIPGMYDGTGKAFFFVNYEEFYQPTSETRDRFLLHPRTEAGIFRYNVTVGGQTVVREVDVLALAAASGQISRKDPTIDALLNEIRGLAGDTVSAGTAVILDENNVNLQTFRFQPDGKYYNHLPTFRLDYSVNDNHRLSGSYWYQKINRFPDIQNTGEATFPGLPNVANYYSLRTVGSVTLRSTLGPNLVNELIGGWQYSPGTFNYGVEASQFENQDMFSLGFPLGATSATRSTNPNTRHQDNWSITNNVSWIKGAHNLYFGGGFSRTNQWNDSTQVVPSIAFGVQSGLDPADGMFTTANFPGASTANLNNARALYAFLTGRVTGVNATARMDENTLTYTYLGVDNIRAAMDEYNVFVQDTWRVKPTVTLNYGLAWVIQQPLRAGNNVFSTTDYAGFCGPYGIGADGQCKLFQPGGDQTGVVPQFVQYTADTGGYSTDWNNIAPNLGVAWRPNVQSGWLRSLLGDPEQATVRAGYSVTYDRPNMGDFLDVYSGNPGRTHNANRNNDGSQYLLVQPGETWPVLFTDKSRLGPPAGIPAGPVYPITATVNNSLSIFDENIQVPYTHSMSVGLQRPLNQDMVLEVRYVGTRGRHAWVTENWNETNVLTNGFLEEFKNAQANLQAHIAQGCGVTGGPACSFAYRGVGTNTVPLPTYLAYLTGTPLDQAGDPARYTASLFTNSTFLGRFGVYEPDVLGSANTDLQTTARRQNAINAGLPSNYFRMNPAVGTNSVELQTSPGTSRYDSLVIELRRRMANGLQMTASFTRTWWEDSTRSTLHQPRIMVRSTNAVPNAFRFTANWDVPVGRGRRYGSNANAWVNGVIGDWAVNAIARVQSGRILTVTNSRLVGMTQAELQEMYKIREDRENKIVYILPDDIILNTRRAFDTSATSANGYGGLGVPEGQYIAPASTADCVQVYPGDCAARNIYLTGPVWSRLDLSFKKTFPFGQSRANFQLEIDVLNVFDAVNFTPVFNPTAANPFVVTAGYRDISQTYDPGGRLMQLAFRVNF